MNELNMLKQKATSTEHRSAELVDLTQIADTLLKKYTAARSRKINEDRRNNR
jgi:hypothetical protein